MLVHDREENINRVPATFETAASPSVPLTVTTLDADHSFFSIFFLNATTGWIGGTGGLYQTTDAGGRWERSGLELPKGATVNKVFFAHQQLGWAVTEWSPGDDFYNADTAAYTYDHCWVNRTTDGGKTWHVQLDLKDSEIYSMRFLNNNEGWITGHTFTNQHPFQAYDFILHTSDQGEHWLDISSELNQSLADYGKHNYLRRRFMDVLPEGPLAATVLLPEGRMYRTVDNGQNWQIVNGPVVLAGGSFASSEHFGGNDEDRLIVGSLVGHWTHTFFATGKGSVWTEYGVGGIGFANVAVLPGNRIFAAGWLDEGEAPNDRAEKSAAVLSYSPDGGKNWEILYKNPRAESITAVTAVDSNDVWAVGQAGLILHVTPQTVLAKR